RDAGVPRVDERSLAFHQHDLGAFGRLHDEPFGGAGDEVGDDGVDGDAPSFDEDAGLAGAGEAHGASALGEPVAQLQGSGHFADVAVGAHGEDDRGVDIAHPSAGDGQV